MRVLALETSTRVGSVALLDGERVLERAGSVDARHGDTLLPMVDDLLREASLTIQDIDLLAAGIGPGSFTGARIALAVCKGLVLGTGLPLVGVSSLCALARELGGRAGIAMDAGRGQVYAAAYACTKDAPAEVLAAPFECTPLALQFPEVEHVAGSAFARFPELAGAHHTIGEITPKARYVGVEAYLRFRARGADDASTLEPLYVRPSDAKLPR